MADTQMFRFLVATDGSTASLHAVDHLVKALGNYKGPIEVHLLNVQPALPKSVTMFVNADQVKQFHNEEGAKALAAAKSRLDSAKVAHVTQIAVGEPAQTIVQYAKEKHCDQIVLGTRGLGAVAGVLVGSVTLKVIQLSETPLLLVK